MGCDLQLANWVLCSAPLKLGGIPKRLKGADCKSVSDAFEGSNPSPSTKLTRDGAVGSSSGS